MQKISLTLLIIAVTFYFCKAQKNEITFSLLTSSSSIDKNKFGYGALLSYERLLNKKIKIGINLNHSFVENKGILKQNTIIPIAINTYSEVNPFSHGQTKNSFIGVRQFETNFNRYYISSFNFSLCYALIQKRKSEINIEYNSGASFVDITHLDYFIKAAVPKEDVEVVILPIYRFQSFYDFNNGVEVNYKYRINSIFAIKSSLGLNYLFLSKIIQNNISIGFVHHL